LQQLQRKQSQRHQTITQRDAGHLFWAAAKERQEEINNNQHRFFFRWGEGAISPEPKKDDGARCCGKGASSMTQHTRDGKTQQSKRELRADIPRKEKINNNQYGFFFLLGEGAISQTEPTKDDGARCCGEGASSLPQRARDGKTQQ